MASVPDFDVAIVGGGVSGIYTAWRLLQAQSNGTLPKVLADWANKRGGQLKVGVYEGTNRIGGRLLSARSPKMPMATCELGGMRYLPSHKRVASLVEELGICPDEFVKPDQEPNIYFLRNKLLRYSQLKDPCALPYKFDASEKPDEGKEPISIIENVLGNALPGFDRERRKGREKFYKWLQGQCVNERKLYEWGFWNLLLSLMSSEAYEACVDTIGYDVLGANYNAVDMIAEIFAFAPDVGYLKLKKGYEFLPWSLKHKFQDLGGKVYLDCWWLKGFTYDSSNKSYKLQFDQDSGPKDPITARALVLAMPRRSIERLLCESPELKHIEGNLNAVDPIRLFKLFLIYEKPWWQQAGVYKGRSLTDMPLRQCYYWAVSESEGPAAIMAYNDVVNTEYWAGLRTEALPPEKPFSPALSQLHPSELRRRTVGREFASPPDFFEATNSDFISANTKCDYHNQLVKNWNAHAADKLQVAEMHRLLRRIHGIRDEKKQTPKPIDAAVADWPDAVHLWKVGYMSWDIMKRMIKPNDNRHLYICGEAYSTEQTWVEGALQTSNGVLKRLGVKSAAIDSLEQGLV